MISFQNYIFGRRYTIISWQVADQWIKLKRPASFKFRSHHQSLRTDFAKRNHNLQSKFTESFKYYNRVCCCIYE